MMEEVKSTHQLTVPGWEARGPGAWGPLRPGRAGRRCEQAPVESTVNAVCRYCGPRGLGAEDDALLGDPIFRESTREGRRPTANQPEADRVNSVMEATAA